MKSKGFVLRKKLIFAIVLFLIFVLLAVLAICNRSSILAIMQRQSDFPETQKKVDTSTWDTSKVTLVIDDDGYKIPVPKGYVASDATGENLVESGFVIYEGTARVTDANQAEQCKVRNQWVWIPVKDSSRLYERDSNTGKIRTKLYDYNAYNATARTVRNDYEPKVSPKEDTEETFTQYNYIGMTQDKFLEVLELEVEEIIRSIEKYGGFYIARYETGDVSTNIPCSKKENADLNINEWHNAYFRQKNMALNSNVMTGMIWGFLYDETLQWLIDVSNKTYEQLVNITTWGRWGYTWKNPNNATIYSAYTKGLDTTGSNENWKSCNIYDLAGNWGEMTVEYVEQFGKRSLRGNPNGFYNGGTTYNYSYSVQAPTVNPSKSDVFNRKPIYTTTERANMNGARAYMCIK